MKKLFICVGMIIGFVWNLTAQNTNASLPGWITRPLSLADCLNIALQQNATILKAKNDLDAQYGVVVQTRAIALPQLQATGQYKDTDPNAIENFPGIGSTPDQNWNAGLQIVQSIYQGGKLTAAVRAAKVTQEQALAQYQATLADTLLVVRLAYYDILLAAEQITVNEASVNLLQKELDDQQRRYDAGTVPHFNVLRAKVSVANARPPLIQAQNNYRIAKNNLSNLLGYNLPREIWENIPLNLTDTLDAAPYEINLSDALQEALAKRPELVALRKTEELQKLNIINAKSGYKPNLQLFAGYNWFNAQFTPPVEIDHDINGWNAGAQVSWDIFDGMLTHGKVIQAKALYEKSKTAVDEEARNIELEVRTTYSDFLEAQEVLESQKTVQAEAEESLREANARADAGTGTQLDVLDAENSLTQARSTQVQALHDYDAARARFERAIGKTIIQKPGPTNP
ncbi:MAG: TolC family protein [Verrucomicrobiia bacterium]